MADSNLIFGGSPLRRYREYVCYDSHFCNAILATKTERVVDRSATCPHHSWLRGISIAPTRPTPSAAALAPSSDLQFVSCNLLISILNLISGDCDNMESTSYLLHPFHHLLINHLPLFLRETPSSLLKFPLQQFPSFSHAQHPSPYLFASTVQRGIKSTLLQHQ